MGYDLSDYIESNDAKLSHFYHIASFISDLKNNFRVEVMNEEIQSVKPRSKSKLLVFDPPSYKITIQLLRKFRDFQKIMIISENPVYLKDSKLKKIFDKFNQVISSIPFGLPNQILSQTSYVYKSIPSYQPPGCNITRKLSALIYSNQFLRKGSNYPLRRKIINILNEVFETETHFYGKNWSYINHLNVFRRKPTIKAMKRLIRVFINTFQANTFYPKVSFSNYRGE